MKTCLPFFLLCFLVLTSPGTQSANSTSNRISTPQADNYSSDSLIVKKPKARKISKAISILSAITGTVLTLVGVFSGSIMTIVYGAVFIVIALLFAGKRRKNTTPADSSKKGLASPGCALLIVGAGIAAIALFFYSILNYSQY